MAAGVPHPELDLESLFLHYNDLYFNNEIESCSVKWSDSFMTSSTGLCTYQKTSCEILLSEPLLKNRSADDLKNTLLHEMIHAYLFFSNSSRRHDAHGDCFKDKMKSINSNMKTDCLRPNSGYKITLFHDFHDDVADEIAHKWECELCHEIIKRATPKEPSHNDCIIQAQHMKRTCGISECNWHRHKEKCNGTYKKISGPSENQANTIGCARLNISEERVKSQAKANKEITNFFSPSSKLNRISIPGSSQSPTGISNPGNSFLKKDGSSRKRKFTTPTNNDSNTQGAPSIQEHKVVSLSNMLLDYYEDDSTDDEIEPLVDKRSVRRKKMEKLREEQMERILNGGEKKQWPIGPPAGGPGFSQEDALEISDDEGSG